MSEDIKPVALLTAMEAMCLDAGGTAIVIPAGTELQDDDCTALYALPDTHRIVPAENLRTLLGVAYIMRQHLRKDSDAIKQMDELQAIADKEPT